MRNQEFQKYLEENLPKVKLEEKPTKFKVTIEEHISQTFEVEATDIGKAMEIAEDKYRRREFVIEPNDPTAKLMMAEDEETGESTEWIQF